MPGPRFPGAQPYRFRNATTASGGSVIAMLCGLVQPAPVLAYTGVAARPMEISYGGVGPVHLVS